MKMFCTGCKFILILPLVLLVPLVHGSSIRTVVYHEGATEGEDTSSSSFEDMDIPPREEWFRVRGDSVPQSRVQAQRYGESDIIALSSGTTRSESTRSSDVLSSEEINEQPIQVHIRPHGKIGFQNERNVEETVQNAANRRLNAGETELSKLPLGSRQENWYQRIRHENGNRNRGGDTNSDRTEENAENEDRSQVGSPIAGKSHESRQDEDRYYDDDDTALLETSAVRSDTKEAFAIANEERQPEVSSDLDSDEPPPHDQVAKMARYIVRNSNWTSVSTISTISSVKGYPFVNVFSVSDGPVNNSTGVPYLYLTPLEMSVIDLKKDSRASATMSLAQSEYCKKQNYDPEDPRCAHVILTGRIVPVRNPDEIEFARNAMFSKHPEMTSWPKDHGWFFAKLNMKSIIVLDYFGGAKTVTVEDYFNQ